MFLFIRFSCKKRTYKYYFPKGNLDIQVKKFFFIFVIKQYNVNFWALF